MAVLVCKDLEEEVVAQEDPVVLVVAVEEDLAEVVEAVAITAWAVSQAQVALAGHLAHQAVAELRVVQDLDLLLAHQLRLDRLYQFCHLSMKTMVMAIIDSVMRPAMA